VPNVPKGTHTGSEEPRQMLHLKVKDLLVTAWCYVKYKKYFITFATNFRIYLKIMRGLPDFQQLFTTGEAIAAEAFLSLQERYHTNGCLQDVVEKCYLAYYKGIRMIKGFMDDLTEALSYCNFFLFQANWNIFLHFMKCRRSAKAFKAKGLDQIIHLVNMLLKDNFERTRFYIRVIY